MIKDSIHSSSLLGQNVTSEYLQLYPRLEHAVEHAVRVSERKVQAGEPDINFRAALALADWRPTHPLEKAAEYFEFDFEFGDEPEDTSIKSNAKVEILIMSEICLKSILLCFLDLQGAC